MSRVEEMIEVGNAYFENKDYAMAIQYYLEGLEMLPANMVLNTKIAHAYLGVQNYMDAEVHAIVLMTHKENSAEGYCLATKAAINQNRIEAAVGYVCLGLKMCKPSNELDNLFNQLKVMEPDFCDLILKRAGKWVRRLKKDKAKGKKKQSHH